MEEEKISKINQEIEDPNSELERLKKVENNQREVNQI